MGWEGWQGRGAIISMGWFRDSWFQFNISPLLLGKVESEKISWKRQACGYQRNWWEAFTGSGNRWVMFQSGNKCGPVTASPHGPLTRVDPRASCVKLLFSFHTHDVWLRTYPKPYTNLLTMPLWLHELMVTRCRGETEHLVEWCHNSNFSLNYQIDQ